MPELNPCAHEFSFNSNNNNNKTLTNDSSSTTNGIDHQQQNNQHDSSSFRLIFDSLVEKSLESIDAIKKSSQYHFDILEKTLRNKTSIFS